jgi:hypothetical protein
MKGKRIFPLMMSVVLSICTLASCNPQSSTTSDSEQTQSVTSDSGSLPPTTEDSEDVSFTDNSDSSSSMDSSEGDSSMDSGEDEEEETVMEKISAQQLFNRVGKSSFKENVTTDEFVGLSNVSEVGVDRAALTKQLYPVPNDSEFSKIFLVEDYGLSVNNADNFAAMSALVREVKQTEGKKLIRFAKGVYKFSSKIVFEDIEDLVIDGNTAEWLVTSWETAFHFSNCKNVQINDFTIDYDPCSNISGEIISSTSNSVKIKVYDEFDLTYSGYNKDYAYGSYMEYIEENGVIRPDPNGNLLYNSTGDGIRNIQNVEVDAANHEISLTFRKDLKNQPQKGKKISLAFTMYEYQAIHVSDSEEVRMDGINLHSAAGMACILERNKNVYINRVNIVLREGSKRLMTATADGFHCKGGWGDLQITGSIVENTHDDAINICTFYKTVVSHSVFDKTLNLSIENSNNNYLIEEGDVIEFYNPSDLSYKATATVKEAVKTGTLTWKVVVKERLSDMTGMLVGNDTKATKVLVKNCIFRNKRNRGILCQFRRSTIENCSFENILHGSVLLPATRDIFGEAILPRDITIKNNKFINNGEGSTPDITLLTYGSSGATAVGNIKGIKLENNAFVNPTARVLWFKGAGSCEISSNLILNPYNISALGTYQTMAMSFSHTQDVVVKNNYFLSEGGVPSPSSNGYVLIADADNSVIQENNKFYNGK